jgi:hypothetical protein
VTNLFERHTPRNCRSILDRASSGSLCRVAHPEQNTRPTAIRNGLHMRPQSDAWPKKEGDRRFIEASWSGHFGLFSRLLLDSGNVETGDRHETSITQPHQDPGAAWVGMCVIRAGDSVAFPTACDDEKRLKWPCFQKMTNITNHATHATSPAVIGQARLRQAHWQRRGSNGWFILRLALQFG